MEEENATASAATYASKLAKIALPLGLVYYLLCGVMLAGGALFLLLLLTTISVPVAYTAYFAIALVGFILYALIGLFAFLARNSLKFTLVVIIILVNVVLSAAAYIVAASYSSGYSYAPPILLLIGIILATVAYFAFLRTRKGMSGVVGGALLLVSVILIWLGRSVSPLFNATMASTPNGGAAILGYLSGIPFGVGLFGSESIMVLVAGIIAAIFILIDAFMPQKYREPIFKTGLAIAGMLFLVGVAISSIYIVMGGLDAIGTLSSASIGTLGSVGGGLVGSGVVAFEYAFFIVLLVAGIIGMIAAILGAIGGGLYIPAAFAAGSRQPSGAQSSEEFMDKVKKLKALLDSGAITKSEFDTQKRKLLGVAGGKKNAGADPLQVKLQELKELYDSGALDEDEYNAQKKAILRSV